MNSFTIFYVIKDRGIYKCVQSVDSEQNKIYEELFEAISSKNQIQCLRLLKSSKVTNEFLNQPIFICDTDCCNTNCVALNICHFAVFNDAKDILGELLKCGGDLSKKTVEVTISGNQKLFAEKDSVIDLIIRRFNEPIKYFQDLFDCYIETADLGNSYEFKFDFSILYPSSGTKIATQGENERQMCVLNEIVNSSYNVYSPECGFLQHPLIETYLTCKWRHYRRFFYILVVMHVLFVTFLSSSAVFIVKNYQQFKKLQENAETGTLLETGMNDVFATFEILNYLLLFVGLQLACHALIQACFIPLRKLIFEFEIISNLVTSSLALVNCIYAIKQPLKGQLKNHWQSQLIYSLNSFIILPAWINLMLIIGRIPSLGCYSLMFTTVMKNFLKVMVSFIFLIIGFALSFSLMFPMSQYFNSPLDAILRTVVMMMGEFDYADTFSENPENTAFSNGMSKFIFVLFVISCSIILMNLTQGIAVNDIKVLHDISQIIRLEKETRFLYEFECIFTQRIMTSNAVLRNIKKRLYDTGAIGHSLTITNKNRTIISTELLAKLIQCYKPTKCIWNRKLSHPKFYFKCLPNRFDVI